MPTASSVTVGAHGPATAALAIIGEAPGDREVEAGRPFVGPSGEIVRGALRAAGIDPDAVLFDNVLHVNPGPFPAGLAGWALLRQHYHDVTPTLASPSRKAVLLFGNQALRRVTGRTGITTWHGSLMYRRDFTEAEADQTALCGRVPVFACVHPAAVLRDPRRAMLSSLIEVVGRAVRAAAAAEPPARHVPVILEPESVDEFEHLTADWQHTVVDTEYDRLTHVPHLVGLASVEQPLRVVSLRAPERFSWAIQRLLNRTSLIAQHAPADLKALAKIGVGFAGYVFDIMQVHALLEPDVEHSLSFIVRTTLDNACEWKWMNDVIGMQQLYNAYDVAYTALAAPVLRSRMDANGLRDVYDREVRLNISRMAMIEDIGIRVSQQEQARLRSVLDARAFAKVSAANQAVQKSLQQRITNLQREDTRLAERRAALINRARQRAVAASSACPTHAKKPYSFAVAPKACAACNLIYHEFITPVKAPAAEIQKRRLKIVQLIKALSEHGFRPTNDNDVRWYVTEVLGRRTRRRTDSGLVSVNAQALTNVADDPVIRDIWDAKHARKWVSTFVNIDVDENGFSHPPVRMHGTSTGRPASGSERAQDDKNATADTAFNAFNIPEPLRSMYVPDSISDIFVGADFSDLEGRLVGLDSGDPTLCRLYRDGVDVHSYLAGICFGIDPATAKKHMVTLGAVTHPARFFAKRVAHGTRYGMGLEKLCQTLEIPLEEGTRIKRLHDQTFPLVVAWQERIYELVFGKTKFDPESGTRVVVSYGQRMLRTATGRQRRFVGAAEALCKEAWAMRPQSHGASIWYRSVDRICEPNSLQLRCGFGRFVIGTYDSFLLNVPRERAAEAQQWLAEQLMQPFDDEFGSLPGAALMGCVFPVDVKVADNYAFGEEL